MELHELEVRLSEAMNRIQQLEDQVNSGCVQERWLYLVARPHRWRQQLCIKGRNMTVGQLVSTVRANHLTPERAAEDLDLPVAAIQEALSYHAENRPLIELEAAEERRRLTERGGTFEPANLPR